MSGTRKNPHRGSKGAGGVGPGSNTASTSRAGNTSTQRRSRGSSFGYATSGRVKKEDRLDDDDDDDDYDPNNMDDTDGNEDDVFENIIAPGASRKRSSQPHGGVGLRSSASSPMSSAGNAIYTTSPPMAYVVPTPPSRALDPIAHQFIEQNSSGPPVHMYQQMIGPREEITRITSDPTYGAAHFNQMELPENRRHPQALNYIVQSKEHGMRLARHLEMQKKGEIGPNTYANGLDGWQNGVDGMYSTPAARQSATEAPPTWNQTPWHQQQQMPPQEEAWSRGAPSAGSVQTAERTPVDQWSPQRSPTHAWAPSQTQTPAAPGQPPAADPNEMYYSGEWSRDAPQNWNPQTQPQYPPAPTQTPTYSSPRQQPAAYGEGQRTWTQQPPPQAWEANGGTRPVHHPRLSVSGPGRQTPGSQNASPTTWAPPGSQVPWESAEYAYGTGETGPGATNAAPYQPPTPTIYNPQNPSSYPPPQNASYPSRPAGEFTPPNRTPSTQTRMSQSYPPGNPNPGNQVDPRYQGNPYPHPNHPSGPNPYQQLQGTPQNAYPPNTGYPNPAPSNFQQPPTQQPGAYQQSQMNANPYPPTANYAQAAPPPASTPAPPNYAGQYTRVSYPMNSHPHSNAQQQPPPPNPQSSGYPGYHPPQHY